MTFWNTIIVAVRALLRHKMRALLTVLGVVIGIAAVTAMVSIGESAGQLVKTQFEALGTNVIVVFPRHAERDGVRQSSLPSLTSADSHAIAAECPSILASSPIVGAGGQLIHGNNNWNARDSVGVGADYLTVRNWPVRRGTMFSERDTSAAAQVCVIGQTVVRNLFQTTDPIDKLVRIRDVPFRVIGVLESKGANMVGEDQDDIVLMPYTTARKRLRGSEFDNVDAILASSRQSQDGESEINLLLAERHRIRPGQRNDFRVQDISEIARVLGLITGTLTLLLASIAGMSLLVGGVGIMNIMLVSVTERTREIGIRMAIGASPGDILRQFLMEAIILSTFGGILGLLLGIGGSVGVTMAINAWTNAAEWPVVISYTAAVIALLFAGGVGIFFGYYPALRASRLDPIEALRYE